MDQKVLEILEKERSSALSISLSDGSPHTACMAFAHRQNPLEILFLTDKKSKKIDKGGSPDKSSNPNKGSNPEKENLEDS